MDKHPEPGFRKPVCLAHIIFPDLLAVIIQFIVFFFPVSFFYNRQFVANRGEK